jgi:hypothetical protein
MSRLSILNILIYIYFSILQVLFLNIVNNFLFIYSHIVLDLFNYIYIYIIFNFNLYFLNYKNTLKNTFIYNVFI